MRRDQFRGRRCKWRCVEGFTLVEILAALILVCMTAAAVADLAATVRGSVFRLGAMEDRDAARAALRSGAGVGRLDGDQQSGHVSGVNRCSVASSFGAQMDELRTDIRERSGRLGLYEWEVLKRDGAGYVRWVPRVESASHRTHSSRTRSSGIRDGEGVP